ncbi:MAG: hypothetical protein WBA92_10530 [Pseudorhodobacter sp.]
MKTAWTFPKLLQALACLMFAFSVVALPALAGTQNHSAHMIHVTASSAAVDTDDHAASSAHCADDGQVAAKADDSSDASLVCCDSMCVAVVMVDQPGGADSLPLQEHRAMRIGTFYAAATIGLLRPPKLI